MLELSRSTVINSDEAEVDLRPGEYRDAINISLIANTLGGFTKGTTYGNIDTGLRLEGLNPDAICLGTAIDPASRRSIIIFFQKIPIPFLQEYKDIIAYAQSRGFRVPSPPVQLAQNLMIVLMKAANIWNSLDVFFCFKGDGDENFAKINWKLPSDATMCTNSGMTYGNNRGFYNPVGQNHYIDTKFVPSAGVKYTLNNCGIIEGIYNPVASAARKNGVLSGVDQTGIVPDAGVNSIAAALNSNTFVTFTSPQITENAGIIFLSRTDAANLKLRKNTSQLFSLASPSSARPTLSYFLGGFNNNGAAANFNSTTYTCWGAGESIESGSRQQNFKKIWEAYENSFINPLDDKTTIRETLMYLFTLDSPTSIPPLVKSLFINDTAESYLDGYSFVGDLFYFNFRNASPKMINIARALNSPGFYNTQPETALTIIKPHPQSAPIVARVPGGVANAPIQKKPFQFMTLYHFLDGEQSVKSPASEFLNSLDDRQTDFSTYDSISVKMSISILDYQMVESVELFVRNTNNIGEWRGVQRFDKTVFARVGTNFEYTFSFKDELTGSFLPLELATKINDAIPINTNYLSFIENRLFAIDTALDYDLLSTWQLKIDVQVASSPMTPGDGCDDRALNPADPLYTQGTFMWDSEYTVGIALYDRYGRKFPTSANDKKLITPRFVPAKLPPYTETDALPNNFDGPATFATYLRQSRISANFDLRAAGNIAAYGKPPKFAHWWGLIRSENTKWEFQIQQHCILRFPYSLTKWAGVDPTKIPADTFLEDDYLYWDTNALLKASVTASKVDNMVNDFIDIIVPANFPYPIDNDIFIDFALEVTTTLGGTGVRIPILDREVVEIFSNKIRIRGDRSARWFRASSPQGVFRKFPKYACGVSINVATGTIGGQSAEVLLRDETRYPLIFKRRRKTNLQSIILYDTPYVFPVVNAGSDVAAFQNQTVTVQRVEFTPLSLGGAPVTQTLKQGDELIQPFNIAGSAVVTNHALKIQWGANGPSAQRLLIEVSIYRLNDEKQPIEKLYSATNNGGNPYRVEDGHLVEYEITNEELTPGWYGYGIKIIPYNEAGFAIVDPEFNFGLTYWEQSRNVASAWSPINLPDGNAVFVRVSELNGAFSPSIYQTIPDSTKQDVELTVVVDAVNILGPNTGGPVTLSPGNTNDATETLGNAKRFIVPYYVDCDNGRTVTINSLKFQLTNPVPAGSRARAELWTVDQTTGEPIAVVAGSVGAFVALSGVQQYTLPFVATDINETGLYGMAIYFEGPTVSDFTDKDFSAGGTDWRANQDGAVNWVFSSGSEASKTYYDRPTPSEPTAFSAIGSDPVSDERIGDTIVVQPVEFQSPDPTNLDGFSKPCIRINWGNNVATGWEGRTVTASIFSIDQGTKLPNFDWGYSVPCIVRSTADDITLLTADERLLSAGWYGMSLEIPQERGPEFVNNKFVKEEDGSAPEGWLQTKIFANTWFGTSPNNTGNGATWIPNGAYPIAQETTYIGQAVRIGEGYKVALSTFGAPSPPNPGDVLYARLYGSKNNQADFVLIEQVTFHAYGQVQSNVVFAPFRNTEYEALWVTFAGASSSGWQNNSNFSLNCFANVFDAQLDDLGPAVKVKGNSGSPVASSRYAYNDQILSNSNFANWLAGWVVTNKPRTATPIGWQVDGNGSGAVYTSIGSNSEIYSSTLYQKRKIPAGNHRLVWSGVGGDISTTELFLYAFDDPNNPLAGDAIHYIIPTAGTPWSEDLVCTFPTSRLYVGILLRNPASPINGRVFIKTFEVTIKKQDFTNMGGANPVKMLNARVTDFTLIQAFPANYYFTGLPSGQTSSSWGQPNIIGTKISVETYLFGGSQVPAENIFDVILLDGGDNELGRTTVNGQTLDVLSTVVVTAINPALVDGLFIRVENSSGVPISMRVRNMSNLSNPPLIQADSTPTKATWVFDQDNSKTELTTGSVTTVEGTEDVPQPPADITVVMANGAGNPISAPQTFAPNDGKKTLVFSPTLSADGNIDFGIMVKNAATNDQVSGEIRIHSITNSLDNGASVSILTYPVDPGNPLFEAWKAALVDGLWARAGYVSNFIAVIDDNVYSAFTPVKINPDCYHLVKNVLYGGIVDHSADPPTDTYKYGIPFPSLSSDPDATGLTFIAKEGQGIGDINIKQNSLKKRNNSNVIRWSDPIIIGSRLNNLNAFLDVNYYAVDFQRGPIQVMLPMHDHTLFCVHETGMSSVYVNRAIMISPGEVQDPQGDALFLTNKVVQNDNKLTSNLGTVNPESCRTVESGTIAYGFDLVRKSLWQKSNNGVRNLTYEGNAKNLFGLICDRRLLAYLAGEDVKVYTGYNEKTKTLYLTFAPYKYRGRTYPGVTIGWNAYLNGFISKYSFVPISYVANESTLVTVKSIETSNPDFIGRKYAWLSTPAGGTADWIRLRFQSRVGADTGVPIGTRIINADFVEQGNYWNQYGLGTSFIFTDKSAQVTLIALGGVSKDLVNASGAVGAYDVRIKTNLPISGVTATLKVYDNAGVAIATLAGPIALTGDDVIPVNQAVAGRIGLILNNSGPQITVNINLFATVVRTYMLYQSVPLDAGLVRVRLKLSTIAGSVKAMVYSFNDLSAPLENLIATVDLDQESGDYLFTANVQNPVRTKYIGVVALSGYDVTLIEYFDVNGVPLLWDHDKRGYNNQFYNVQYETEISLIFNVENGQIRLYNSLGVKSGDVWEVADVLTSNANLSFIPEENFRLRDGVYYASFLRDILTPQASLPDPVKNTPLLHGRKLTGVWMRLTLRNQQTFRQIELRAVYLGSDELAGHYLNKK